MAGKLKKSAHFTGDDPMTSHAQIAAVFVYCQLKLDMI